ncbi:MAG: capsular biosynthesis protein [Proteobacteria bacterium]|nr:capsular biosynthesis protein [Pseudomonadota bacterium]
MEETGLLRVGIDFVSTGRPFAIKPFHFSYGSEDTLKMIDLHCHMLPGIDDGAPDRAVAVAMARCAANDGITHVACTPHIYPGLYDNCRDGILRHIEAFRAVLAEEGIDLQLVVGADTHLTPDLLRDIRAGLIPTLNDTRYLLFEPPHHVAPPRLEESVFNLLVAGIVPVVTHPERLSWIESNYETFERLVDAGALMQITAGSVTGRFGGRPKYWAERMLEDGMVHLLATDAHHVDKRPPLMREARDAAAAIVGDEEATHLVLTRPRMILENRPPDELPEAIGAIMESPVPPTSFWARLFGKG